MQKIILGLLTTVVYIFTVLFGTQLAYASVPVDCNNPQSTQEAITCGSSNSSGVPVSNQPDQSLSDTLKVAIQYISLAVGAVAVIMVLVGGFRYVASAGNQEAIAGARKTITYALIGLLIAAVAQILVHFVLQHTTEAINGTTPTGGKPAAGVCTPFTSPTGGTTNVWSSGPKKGQPCP